MSYFRDLQPGDLVCPVDVETTGCDFEKDRIVSIFVSKGKIDKSGYREMAVFDIPFINPEISIPKEASKIHGIYDKQIQNSPVFKEIAQELRDFVGKSLLISHNASFDKKFINSELKRTGLKGIHRNRSYCTMLALSNWNSLCLGGCWRYQTLENAARIFSVSGRNNRIHTAEEDVRITIKIAEQLFNIDKMGEIPDHTIRNIKKYYVNHTYKQYYSDDYYEDSESETTNSSKIFFFILGVVILLLTISST